LNDPFDQEARFQKQVDKGGHEAPKEVDVDYIRALAHGLPPTAGEGIGIDRLVMLLTDSHAIREVVLFPLLRKESTGGEHDEAEGPAADPGSTSAVPPKAVATRPGDSGGAKK
jgi:lysyl-tRNA synthetase class 2